jgi:HEAT repeat protein
MSDSDRMEGEVLSVGHEQDLERLVQRLAYPDPHTQMEAFAAMQTVQDYGVWYNLLTLMTAGTVDGERVPDLLAGSEEQHRIALKIYALFAQDAVAATVPVKRQALLAGLHHVDPDVRRTACELLGQRRTGQAVDALIATLQDDHASRVRRAAAAALAKIGDPAAVGPLVAALSQDDGLLRERAREALAKFGHLAVAPLTELLTAEEDRTRWEAAKTLAEIADPAAAPALVRALEDENGGVRWLAGEGLIALGKAGLPPLLEALVERSDSVWLRKGAHHVLRSVPTDDGLWAAVAPVLDALEDVQPDIGVIEPAHVALQQLRRPRWQGD